MDTKSLTKRLHMGESHALSETKLLHMGIGLMLLWALLNGMLGIVIGHLITDLESDWPLILVWGAFAAALPVFTAFVMFKLFPDRQHMPEERYTAENLQASESYDRIPEFSPEPSSEDTEIHLESEHDNQTAQVGRSAKSIQPIDSIENEGVNDQDASDSEKELPRKGRFYLKCEEISRTYLLSKRESEVLPLLAKGHNAAFIQDKLCVSRSTAKTHINHIYRKLNIHTQQELLNMVEDRKHVDNPEEIVHVFGSSQGAMQIDNPRKVMEQALKKSGKHTTSSDYRTNIFTN